MAPWRLNSQQGGALFRPTDWWIYRCVNPSCGTVVCVGKAEAAVGEVRECLDCGGPARLVTPAQQAQARKRRQAQEIY